MAVEQYNELFASGKLNFVDFNMDHLPATTKKYVVMWIAAFDHSIKMHNPPIEGVYLFAIEHPIVKYLMHDSVNMTHMWGDKNFKNVDGNLALAMLSEKRTGLGIERTQEILERFDKAFEEIHEKTEET